VENSSTDNRSHQDFRIHNPNAQLTQHLKHNY
jgi:hypothetical protein